MRGNRGALVTGVGAVTRIGIGFRATLEAWRGGKVATGPIEPFEPGDLEGVRDPRRIAKAVRLAACAALEAWREAGLEARSPDAVDAVFAASALGCLDHSRDFHSAVIRRAGPSPMLFTESVLNATAGHLAIERGLHGGAHALSTFLYDGLEAARLAFEAVASGRAERALLVGCDSWIPELEPVFRNCGVLRGESEGGGCVPFSPAREGFRLGEAAGALVLESPASAERRGARPLARIAQFVGALRPGEPGEAVAAVAAAGRGIPPPRWIFPSANGGVCEAIEEPLFERLGSTGAARASIKPAIGEAFAGTAAVHLALGALAAGGERIPLLPGPPASDEGDGAWVLGADPAGSVSLARLLPP